MLYVVFGRISEWWKITFKFSDPNLHHNRPNSSLPYTQPTHQISSKSVLNFLRHFVHKQTDRQTVVKTTPIPSVAEVIRRMNSSWINGYAEEKFMENLPMNICNSSSYLSALENYFALGIILGGRKKNRCTMDHTQAVFLPDNVRTISLLLTNSCFNICK